MDLTPAQVPLPWQQAQWLRLVQQLHRDTLHHAILLVGQGGLGLELFARQLAQLALCRERNNREHPCGACPACLQYQAGVNPDYKAIELLDDKKQLLVDQIRELGEFMALSSGNGDGFKVIVIDPADRMNVNASNSLLKTLEEPPGKSLLILVASELHRLPATIKSRCQMVKFARPAFDQALDWLQQRQVKDADKALHMAQGAPVAALEMAEDELQAQFDGLVIGAIRMLAGKLEVFELRQEWKGITIPHAIEWSMALMRDCIRVASHVTDAEFENPAYLRQLRQLGPVLDLQALFRSYDHLGRMHRIMEHPLNPDLVMDDILLTWQSLTRS